MFRIVLALFALVMAALWRAEGSPQDEDEGAGSSENAESGPRGDEGKTFSQDDVDRIVSERLRREREKQEREQEEARRKAREEALKEQGKYKEIAEQHAQTISDKDERIRALEGQLEEASSYKERYEALEERYARMIEDRLSVVPEPFRPLLEQMSVTERADWLEKNAEKLGAAPEMRPRGSRPTGPPARRPTDGQGEGEARRRQAHVTRTAF